MRIAIPLLAVLIGAAILWFAFQSDERATDDLGVTDAGEPDDGMSAGLLQGSGPDPEPDDGTKKAKASNLPKLDPRTAPRGDLTVIPVDADDNVIPIGRVKVKVMADGRRWPHQPLGHRNPNTGAWEFRKLFTGPVKIVCSGDTFLDTVAKARVTVRGQDPVRVFVKPGGAIHWQITYDNGALPKKLKLELFRDGRRHIAWFEERHRTRISSRLRTHTIELGHTGYITGLKTGPYTLRATNKDGYYRDAELNVGAGEVVPAVMTLRDTADAKPSELPKKDPEPVAPPIDPSNEERNPDGG